MFCKSVPIARVLATPAQVEALSKSPYVKSVYLNKKLTYINSNGTHITGVQRLRTDPNFISKNKGVPVYGKAVGVMVNDSGVDGTHEDITLGTHLVQNVLGSINLNALSTLLPVTYLENVPNTDTNLGHGSCPYLLSQFQSSPNAYRQRWNNTALAPTLKAAKPWQQQKACTCQSP
ncbi:hypothetical protein [Rufibacter sp. XAAS-G3-1]|uniref:hypothetical protein n=1 Tax=Rufibacter sp. XAAS-G3-1 TaxID=2729134 RepID=UPI0015E75246|nr:hypothetical protein [Rufibacter sp. XAAS-G3-1]